MATGTCEPMTGGRWSRRGGGEYETQEQKANAREDAGVCVFSDEPYKTPPSLYQHAPWYRGLPFGSPAPKTRLKQLFSS
jgi:hypothetical protein